MRPSWEEYFLAVADAVSLRSDCRRAKVGAVLVDDHTHRILSTGYVGVAPGQPGCLSGACPRGLKSFDEVPPYSDYSNCISTHAEENCIYYALKWYGLFYPYESTTLYITRAPCQGCIEYSSKHRVRRFIYRDGRDGSMIRWIWIPFAGETTG